MNRTERDRRHSRQSAYGNQTQRALYDWPDDEPFYDSAAPDAPTWPVTPPLPPQRQRRPSFWSRLWLVFVGMLLVGGILATFSLSSIEAALTLPPQTKTVSVSRQPPPAASSTMSARPANPTSTAPTNPAMLLAQDTFQRADQQGWGTASDGHPWGADADSAVFSIKNNKGRITNGKGALNAILGPAAANAEVLFTGSISLFRQANMGAVLRWMDANDWYKAYIDGSRLILLKDDGGMQTRLAAVPFTAKAGVYYSLRFRIQGTTLQARAWPAGDPEPAQWMVSARDTTFQSGLGGLRVFSVQGIIIKITAFKETLLNG